MKSGFRQNVLGIIWGAMSASRFDGFWRNGSRLGVFFGSFGIVSVLCLPLAFPWWYILAHTWTLGQPAPSWTRAFFDLTPLIVLPYYIWMCFWFAVHWIILRRKMTSVPRQIKESLLFHAASVLPIQYLLAWPFVVFACGVLLIQDVYGFTVVERTHEHYRTIYYGLRNVAAVLCWVSAAALTWVGLRNNLRRLKRMLAETQEAETPPRP